MVKDDSLEGELKRTLKDISGDARISQTEDDPLLNERKISLPSQQEPGDETSRCLCEDWLPSERCGSYITATFSAVGYACITIDYTCAVPSPSFFWPVFLITNVVTNTVITIINYNPEKRRKMRVFDQAFATTALGVGGGVLEGLIALMTVPFTGFSMDDSLVVGASMGATLVAYLHAHYASRNID